MQRTKVSPLTSALSLLAKALSLLCMLLLIVIAGAVTWQVISRYATMTSAAWAQELASYSFVWLSMLAIALAARSGAHMKLDVWVKAQPGGVLDKIVSSVAALVTLATVGAIGWYGADGLETTFSRSVPGLGISFGWVALAVPVGMGLSAVFILEAWMHSMRRGPAAGARKTTASEGAPE